MKMLRRAVRRDWRCASDAAAADLNGARLVLLSALRNHEHRKDGD